MNTSEHKNMEANNNNATTPGGNGFQNSSVVSSSDTRNDAFVIEPEEANKEGLHAATNNEGDSGNPPNATRPRRNHRRRHFLIGFGALAASLAVGLYYVAFVAPYESTDDAFIAAHVTSIAPQVPARGARLLVQDNQEVRPGDVLVQIDPSDYQAKLDQERANLAAAQSRLEQANAQFAADQAKVAQEKANVIAAEAEAKRATADLKRYLAVGRLGVSESQIDLASAQSRSSDAAVDAAREFATTQTWCGTIANNDWPVCTYAPASTVR